MSDKPEDYCPWCGSPAFQNTDPHTSSTMEQVADEYVIFSYVRCPNCNCRGPTATITYPKGENSTPYRVTVQDKAWELWRKRP